MLDKEKVITAVMESLNNGASIGAAVKAAGTNAVTFWRWRMVDKELDDQVHAIYDSRIQIVEDALYRGAVEGNPTQQIFFLKNRAYHRWRDRYDIPPMIDQSQHYHFTKLSDDELLEYAREAGISIQAGTQRRIEQTPED